MSCRMHPLAAACAKLSWMLPLQSGVEEKYRTETEMGGKNKNQMSRVEGRELVPRNRTLSTVWEYLGFRASNVKREQIIQQECPKAAQVTY